MQTTTKTKGNAAMHRTASTHHERDNLFGPYWQKLFLVEEKGTHIADAARDDTLSTYSSKRFMRGVLGVLDAVKTQPLVESRIRQISFFFATLWS